MQGKEKLILVKNMSVECAIRLLREAIRDGIENIALRHEHAPDGTIMVRAFDMDEMITDMKDALRELELEDDKK